MANGQELPEKCKIRMSFYNMTCRCHIIGCMIEVHLGRQAPLPIVKCIAEDTSLPGTIRESMQNERRATPWKTQGNRN